MKLITGDDWTINVPTQGLASHSLLIKQKGKENPVELFRMMQQVAQFWERQGIKNYLVYASSADQGWEMVPVRGQESSKWDRACAFVRSVFVMCRVTFGRYTLSASEKKTLYKEYQKLTSFDAKKSVQSTIRAAKDVFCKKEVINSQLVWEGKHIRVLYNYAPLGKEELRFLLVPKMHKERLSQLTEEEFIEMQTCAQKLKNRFSSYLCHRFNKSGQLAGQTVKHFHEHVVFVLPQNNFWAKLSVFYRMIIPSTPFSSSELAQRVAYYKKEFQNVFTEPS